MRNVAGESARGYNRRKGRINALWGDNFHATMVEDGRYLWRSLYDIELNMVRCGVVDHPRDCAWVEVLSPLWALSGWTAKQQLG
jgi:hypothetical protein